MDVQELIVAGFPKAIANTLAKLQEFAPHHWKGNFPPDVKHFDSVDHFAAGGHLDTKTLWLELDYTQDGATHQIRAESPVAEFGQRGIHCTLTVDGASEPGQMTIGHREGIEGLGVYERAIVEFWYGDADEKHVRFDGDLL